MDGTGSLLDADTLDGIDSSSFLRGTRYYFSGANGTVNRSLPGLGNFDLSCQDGRATMQFQNFTGGDVTLFSEQVTTNSIDYPIVADLETSVIINAAYTTDRYTVRAVAASRSVTWDAWVRADVDLRTCIFDLTEIDQG